MPRNLLEEPPVTITSMVADESTGTAGFLPSTATAEVSVTIEVGGPHGG